MYLLTKLAMGQTNEDGVGETQKDLIKQQMVSDHIGSPEDRRTSLAPHHQAMMNEDKKGFADLLGWKLGQLRYLTRE